MASQGEGGGLAQWKYVARLQIGECGGGEMAEGVRRRTGHENPDDTNKVAPSQTVLHEVQLVLRCDSVRLGYGVSKARDRGSFHDTRSYHRLVVGGGRKLGLCALNSGAHAVGVEEHGPPSGRVHNKHANDAFSDLKGSRGHGCWFCLNLSERLQLLDKRGAVQRQTTLHFGTLSRIRRGSRGQRTPPQTGFSSCVSIALSDGWAPQRKQAWTPGLTIADTSRNGTDGLAHGR